MMRITVIHPDGSTTKAKRLCTGPAQFCDNLIAEMMRENASSFARFIYSPIPLNRVKAELAQVGESDDFDDAFGWDPIA